MKSNLRVICLLSVLLGLSGCNFFWDVEPPTSAPPDVGDDIGDTDPDVGANNESDAGDNNTPGNNNHNNDADAGDPDAGDATEPPLACTCEVPEHAVATCTEEDPGTCTFACAEGFVSLEGDAALGCGCELVEGEDVPGDGVDTDCDGFDGVLASTVFVAPDAEGDGLSPDAPMGSIAAALELAHAEGRTYVLVAAGTYTENLTLHAGIHLYGGYAADGFARDVEANEVVIVGSTEAPERPTVLASGLDAPTRLDGLTIQGPNLASGGARSGATSYGVLVVDSGDRLEIVGSTIVGGVGDDGAHGANGEQGAAGEPGRTADTNQGGGYGSSNCGSDGGEGGTALSCTVSEANTPGASGLPALTDANAPGAGGGGGRVGASDCSCGVTVSAGNGSEGQQGKHGANGAAGAPPESPHGRFDPVTGHWRKAEGAEATAGQPGGGGGGGGAGGSVSYLLGACSGQRGGGGGGGGGGGCGGTAGESGEQGGGSFALLLVRSSVRVEGTTVVLGSSGAGGDGGDGAPGGVGGASGSPRNPGNSAGAGGLGGRGGQGGAGAPGAGGCGGLVVGAALVGDGATLAGEVVYQTPETSTVGAGGAQGSWPPGAGVEPGAVEPCAGARHETHTWPGE